MLAHCGTKCEGWCASPMPVIQTGSFFASPAASGDRRDHRRGEHIITGHRLAIHRVRILRGVLSQHDRHVCDLLGAHSIFVHVALRAHRIERNRRAQAIGTVVCAVDADHLRDAPAHEMLELGVQPRHRAPVEREDDTESGLTEPELVDGALDGQGGRSAAALDHDQAPRGQAQVVGQVVREHEARKRAHARWRHDQRVDVVLGDARVLDRLPNESVRDVAHGHGHLLLHLGRRNSDDRRLAIVLFHKHLRLEDRVG